MRNEAIQLWARLQEKQKAEKEELEHIHRQQTQAFERLMDYACDLDVTTVIDDFSARSDEAFEKLRRGLDALNKQSNGQYPYVGGEGVDFTNPNAKPFVQ
jgi:hypothetical protein